MTTKLSPETRQKLDEQFAQSFVRAQRGRALATAMFQGALILVGLIAFMFQVDPTGPMSLTVGMPAVALPLVVGIVGVVVGLVWMRRILRAQADPEAGARPWRYRGPDSDF